MTANAAHTPAEVHEAMMAISSTDKEAQGTAFQFLMRETDHPVSWSYVIWDDLIAALSHKDNRTRAICRTIALQSCKERSRCPL